VAQWEYLQLTFTFDGFLVVPAGEIEPVLPGFQPFTPANPDRPELPQGDKVDKATVLNALGRKGWELVGVSVSNPTVQELIFKRPENGQ